MDMFGIKMGMCALALPNSASGDAFLLFERRFDGRQDALLLVAGLDPEECREGSQTFDSRSALAASVGEYICRVVNGGLGVIEISAHRAYALHQEPRELRGFGGDLVFDRVARRFP